jgi:hypothetical protein
LDVFSSSRSRTGPNAANAEAAKARAQKQRIERMETADRRDSTRTPRAKAKERDAYEPGAAAYVAKRTRMRSAPDQQRYEAHPRTERNHQAESRRSGRA